MTMIKVTDDGNGINKSDLHLLCLRYHTSKIREYDMFTEINTLGFRGEALNAISLNSKLTIQSNTNPNSNLGY